MQLSLKKAGIALQRAVWSRRAQSWEDTPNPGLDRVVDAIVAIADTQPYATVLDLGCGSGQLALPLAASATRVVAVDIAESMLVILRKKAEDRGISNVETQCISLEELQVEPKTIDLIVTNYVLHHLADAEKQAVLHRCAGWLSPNGRLIIGDMMFGRGASADDRKIILDKVAKLAKLGPGGWWRIIKNVGRFTLRVQEKPVSAETWRRYLAKAGFTAVDITPVVAEASIAVARLD